MMQTHLAMLREIAKSTTDRIKPRTTEILEKVKAAMATQGWRVVVSLSPPMSLKGVPRLTLFKSTTASGQEQYFAVNGDNGTVTEFPRYFAAVTKPGDSVTNSSPMDGFGVALEAITSTNQARWEAVAKSLPIDDLETLATNFVPTNSPSWNSLHGFIARQKPKGGPKDFAMQDKASKVTAYLNARATNNVLDQNDLMLAASERIPMLVKAGNQTNEIPEDDLLESIAAFSTLELHRRAEAARGPLISGPNAKSNSLPAKMTIRGVGKVSIEDIKGFRSTLPRMDSPTSPRP